MTRVFLSYARDDVDCARQVADVLGRAGHEVWWDQHIQGGSRFTAAIDRALKDAQAVVVLWSPTSVESAWVQDEAAEGRDSGRLVPVLIGETKPPLGFRQFQSVDLSGWNGDRPPAQLDALIDAITRTADNGEAASPTPKRDDRAGSKRISICVLPFVNMSDDPAQEYFSDGIAEDIITDLSKVSALSVVARNTAFTFKGKAIDVKEVASTLGVSHVLEGSVRKAGDRVRITAQLIDGNAGDHLWADRYDRDLTDIFAIQDEISKAIVAALRVKLLPEEKKAIETRGTTSIEAYNLYLMARQRWLTGTSGDMLGDESVVRLCRQAIAFDSNYAQPWALMALAQLQLRLWHARDVDALPSAERALSLNPNLAEARCVKAHLLDEEGRTEEANEEIEAALRLAPDSWEVNREAGHLLFRQGRIREAAVYFEKAAAASEFDWSNPGLLMTCYHEIGDLDQLRRVSELTVERTEKALAKDPANATALATGAGALAILGDEKKARNWINRALLLDPDNILMRYNLACALAVDLNDKEGALEVVAPYFERVVSHTQIRHIDSDPDMDGIRDDPRFKELMDAAKQRLGIAAADS